MRINISRTSMQNIALYFYFFSINFESVNLYGYGSSSFFAGLIYLILISPSVKIFTAFNDNLKFFFPLVLFFVWLIFISLININSFSSRFFDLAFFLNILIFFTMVNHASKDKLALEKGFFFFAIGSIIAATLLFLGIGVDESDEGLRAGRQTFFNSGPNEFGIKLVTGAAVIIAILIQDNLKLGRYRYLLALFLPIIINGILNTASRTAILCLLLLPLTWMFFRVLKSKYKFYALFSGLFFVFISLIPVGFFILQNQIVLDRIEYTSVSNSDFEELGRFFLWLGFYNLLFENLIFGNGLSGFDLITFKYFGFVESPHNIFLEIILYTGLIGLTIYFIFFFRTIYASYRLFKDFQMLLPILLLPTIFAYSMALQALTEKICWVVFAYIVGTYLIKKPLGLKNYNENINSN
tara:strand:+ start:33861 stop:35090 length:1230 start_codon:yes stop_codon:yes gene_type:complete